MTLKLSGTLTTLEIATTIERETPYSVVVFRVGDWCIHEHQDTYFAVSHASGLSAASALAWPSAMLLLHRLQELPTAPASIVELRRQRKAREYSADVGQWVDLVIACVQAHKGEQP